MQRATALIDEHDIVGCPIGTRLYRVERVSHAWRVWIATTDCVYGTYLLLHDHGTVQRVTARCDEGDDTITVRPSDYVVQLIRKGTTRDG